MHNEARIAGVELGGTKAIAVLSRGNRIVDRYSVSTTAPAETLGAIRAKLLAWHAAAPFDALGIASFGPLGLVADTPKFGHILETPKPGWSGADIRAAIAAPFACPWSIDTDVNGAALAEWMWGAGQGCTSLCYVTIGTGLGGGLVIDGRPVHGAMHPEIGHMRLRRAPGDGFAGICPFHGDCLEGLVSGPALAARFDQPGADISDSDPRWANVVHDLAEMAAALLVTVAPQKIVIGGGMGLGRQHLLPMIGERAAMVLAGYLPYFSAENAREVIVSPHLGADAGPLGAIALGLDALHLNL